MMSISTCIFFGLCLVYMYVHACRASKFIFKLVKEIRHQYDTLLPDVDFSVSQTNKNVANTRGLDHAYMMERFEFLAAVLDASLYICFDAVFLLQLSRGPSLVYLPSCFLKSYKPSTLFLRPSFLLVLSLVRQRASVRSFINGKCMFTFATRTTTAAASMMLMMLIPPIG